MAARWKLSTRLVKHEALVLEVNPEDIEPWDMLPNDPSELDGYSEDIVPWVVLPNGPS